MNRWGLFINASDSISIIVFPHKHSEMSGKSEQIPVLIRINLPVQIRNV